MKLFILLSSFVLVLFSCTATKTVTITNAGNVEGRPIYNVKLPNGKTIESMYSEEIAHGLKTGNWNYNEDLKLNY